jgi:hypothetical protein
MTFPVYSLPLLPLLRFIPAWWLGLKRPFQTDARQLLQGMQPPPQVSGIEHILPPGTYPGGCLLTLNHYQRDGFGIWWAAIALSAILPVEIRWIVTSAWIGVGTVRNMWVCRAVTLLLGGLARVYDFIRFPPMPPRPQEAQARALALRHVVQAVRANPQVLLGLAPEGGDSMGGTLILPPPGAGKFIHHLGQMGMVIQPVGIYEENGRFCLNFAAPYHLETPPGLPSEELDLWVRRQVMVHIAPLLPPGFRGEFGS